MNYRPDMAEAYVAASMHGNTAGDSDIQSNLGIPNTQSSPLCGGFVNTPMNPSGPMGMSGPSQISGITNIPNKGNNPETQPILTKPRLQELVREVDPTEQLDEEVEEVLLQIADDFIEDTVKAACLIAKHRKVAKVEVKDVQLHLERKWNMWIPGFGTDELKPYKRASVTEAHKQRLALIRKTIKKY